MGAWGIQPSEFWGMTQEEWFWVFDAKRTDKSPTFGMSEADLADLYELIKDG